MVEQLIKKISEESGKDIDEIQERIDNKVEEMAGLVSEEGAAHLIAREEGVELATAEERALKVENIVPGMNRVDVTAKIVDITDTNTFTRKDGEEGQVRNIVLGDDTGTVRMSLWDEQVDVAEKVEVGEVIQVSGAYTRSDNRGNAELRIGKATKIDRSEDEIENVKAQSSGGGGSYDRVPINKVLNENHYYEVQGTVVEIYTDNPFYRACPECNKSVKEDGDAWTCKEHGTVEPQYNMILNAIVDDGYGNVRVVFFTDRARAFLGLDEPVNGNTEKVKDAAARVKGREVVVRGQSRYNDYFNRLEMMGNEVDFPEENELIEAALAAVTADE